jgi:hypothetical protein
MWLFTRVTSKWHFFPKTPKIGTFVVQKFWMLIFSPNQACLEHVRALSSYAKKNLSKGVSYAWIRNHLTVVLRGFLIGSQIFNLIPTPSFDHNSCILGLNEQCKGTLGIYTLRNFQWYHKDPIWCLFIFLTKILNIQDSRTNATPKVEVHLWVIGLHPLHSLSFVAS